MKKIQFFGAAGGVTGSCYLLTLDNVQFLIDLGMFQGKDDTGSTNNGPLPFDVSNLEAVFVTHAHLDHCGRLPLLIQNGYRGKIYTTEASKEIIHLTLLDSANLAIENHQASPLYTKAEVERTWNQIETVSYDQPLNLAGCQITFRNAGHILGSASIGIHDQEGKIIVFSGDLGNFPEDLIQPTYFFEKADSVVLESTYGGNLHPDEDISGILQKEINEVERTNGALLIPAFSVERSQEVLNRISLLKKAKKINPLTKVYLDSPMAIEVTEIFKKYPKLFSKELSEDPNPLDFQNLFYTDTPKESKAITKVPGPKIIIAGSGMMNGGRILHHLYTFGPLKTTRILIVGYQAEDTLGREILEGAKEVEIYDEKVPLFASVTYIESLSSHADQPKLLTWLKHINGVQKVFITHGEQPSREALRDKITTELGISDVVLPSKEESFNIS